MNTLPGAKAERPTGAPTPSKLGNYPEGTRVRFTEQFLTNVNEADRKRYVGREGIIRGYRLQPQDEAKPRPIVKFPKFGRYKEELYYEMSWADIEVIAHDVP